jgi:hypothetical protein
MGNMSHACNADLMVFRCVESCESLFGLSYSKIEYVVLSRGHNVIYFSFVFFFNLKAQRAIIMALIRPKIPSGFS